MLTARRPARRGRYRWTLAGALALIALLLGSQTASGAQPPLLPPIGNSPGHFYGDGGANLLGRTTVSKAKLAIEIPQTLLYVRTDSFLKFATSGDLTDFFLTASGYVVSPTGQAQRYGNFAPIVTRLIAFGAIPVDATIQLSQVLTSKGYLQPLVISSHTKYTPTANAPTQVTDPTKVTGSLRLSISHVKVDGVALDVGPGCGTAEPVQINLISDSNYNIGTGGLLNGNADVGAFAHCGVRGDDLDPLLDGLVSAPTNKLTMSQGNIGVWVPPQSCPDCTDPLPLPAPAK